jgi:hypothetical protein
MGCEFIINDETLIAPAKLIDLQGHEPLYKTGQVRWYQRPRNDRTYVIALDPSLGTGGDPAAIQVYEAETTEQVAEWRKETGLPEKPEDYKLDLGGIVPSEKDLGEQLGHIVTMEALKR